MYEMRKITITTIHKCGCDRMARVHSGRPPYANSFGRRRNSWGFSARASHWSGGHRSQTCGRTRLVGMRGAIYKHNPEGCACRRCCSSTSCLRVHTDEDMPRRLNVVAKQQRVEKREGDQTYVVEEGHTDVTRGTALIEGRMGAEGCLAEGAPVDGLPKAPGSQPGAARAGRDSERAASCGAHVTLRSSVTLDCGQKRLCMSRVSEDRTRYNRAGLRQHMGVTFVRLMHIQFGRSALNTRTSSPPLLYKECQHAFRPLGLCLVAIQRARYIKLYGGMRV